MFVNAPIVLRKVAGVLTACRRLSTGPRSGAARDVAPSFLSTAIAFAGALLMPLLMLAAIAGLMTMHAHAGVLASHSLNMSFGGMAFAGLIADADVKTLFADLNTAFVAFRTANDERLKAIETKGSADVLITNKVDAANTAITAITAQITAVENNLRELEIANARIPNGSREDRDKEVVNATQFFSLVREKPVATVSDADLASYRNYRAALAAHLRRGEQLTPDMRAALQTGQAPNGGFWVTPDTSGRIVELMQQTSPVRQLASVQPIGTDMYEGFNDLDEADSGWVGETEARPDTNTPQTGKYQIPVHEQYASPKSTQKQLDDSMFNVESWLAKKVSSKLSRRENTAFVGGNGVGKPRGFTTYAAGTPTAAVWNVIQRLKTGVAGGFAVTSPADKIIDLIAALKPEYRQGAKFAMSSLTLAEVRKLKDAQGHYLLIPDFSKSSAGSLLGFDVAELQDMATIAVDSLSIAFAKWDEAYTILDHTVGVRVLRDPYTATPYVKFYTTKRVGGDIVNFEAIKLLQFGV
jgi:HK97 family phage major capsid protein